MGNKLSYGKYLNIYITLYYLTYNIFLNKVSLSSLLPANADAEHCRLTQICTFVHVAISAYCFALNIFNLAIIQFHFIDLFVSVLEMQAKA